MFPPATVNAARALPDAGAGAAPGGDGNVHVGVSRAPTWPGRGNRVGCGLDGHHASGSFGRNIAHAGREAKRRRSVWLKTQVNVDGLDLSR